MSISCRRSMGSGAALFDFDSDGRLDIYLLHNGGPHGRRTTGCIRRMPDGTFKDVSAGSGLDIAGYNMGVAVGDVNNDGRPDVLVTAVRRRPALPQPAAAASFADVTAEAGLSNPLLGHLGRLPRLRPRRLARPRRRQLPRLRPARGRAPGRAGRRDYCHPATFPGTVTQAVPQPRQRPGGPQASASRT